MRKKFKATKGAPFSKSDAQLYGEALDKISQENNGTVSPAGVVEKAKNTRNPLHRFFDWNDGDAAEKYRLWQARNLINHITIEIRYDHTKKEQKAFFSVNSTPDETKLNRTYITVERVLSEPQLRKQVLKRAFNEVEYWKSRYTQYNELEKIFKAIRETKKIIKRKIVKKKK